MNIEGITINTYPLRTTNMKEIVKKIYPCPISLSICPCCGGKLHEYVYPIQISDSEASHLNGAACFKCDSFFTKKTTECDALITLPDVCKYLSQTQHQIIQDLNIAYDHKYYFSFLYDPSSFFCQITLCNSHHIRTFTIVTKRSLVDISRDTIHYSDSLALQLLTAVYLDEQVITIEDEVFFIQDIFKLPEILHPTVRLLAPNDCVGIQTKRNGGYYDPDPNVIQVTGLVFCENSKHLEPISLSYSKEDEIYYVDNQVFLRFARIHGWMIVRYMRKYKNEWSELRDESLLHQFGYNVSSKSALRDSERHAILAHYVETGVGDVHQVVNLLNSFIRRNGVKFPKARQKWEMDIEFISQYKVDPEKLVFVSKIRNRCLRSTHP